MSMNLQYFTPNDFVNIVRYKTIAENKMFKILCDKNEEEKKFLILFHVLRLAGEEN